MYEWATGIRELSVAEHSEPPPVKSSAKTATNAARRGEEVQNQHSVEQVSSRLPPQLVVHGQECKALSSLKSLLNDHIRQRIQVTDNSVAKLIRLGGECH